MKKKAIFIFITALLLFAMTGCDEAISTSIPIEQLKTGDTVSIIGQKANHDLVNDNTIWVQEQQEDGTFVLYHCQLEEEYIDEAEDIDIAAAVKVKGSFLSLMDLKQENTMPIVKLYDCTLKK